MKKSEMAKILLTELDSYQNIKFNEAYVLSWFNQFSAFEPELFAKYLRATVRNIETGFPPTVGQVWAIIKRHKKETMPSDIKQEISEYAYAQALRRFPKIAGDRQFRNPEEMQEALFWNEKNRDDEAEKIEDDLMKNVIDMVAIGSSYKNAIAMQTGNLSAITSTTGSGFVSGLIKQITKE